MHVFIGKDIITTRKKGWQVNHWQDYKILDRIRGGLETSGILLKWPSLREESEKLRVYSLANNQQVSEEKFKKSDLKGNF